MTLVQHLLWGVPLAGIAVLLAAAWRRHGRTPRPPDPEQPAGAPALPVFPDLDPLSVLNRAGVVHRDLTAGNLMVTPAGVVKVLDLSLALVPDEVPLTVGPAFTGTPGRNAPEQVCGERELQGPATDVYALGVVLYECLA